jgi:D-alanine transaminase
LTRIVYVDGRYVPYAEAAVHAEDRGFLFADAVYEVCELIGGAIVDEERHLDRLQRSLDALAIPMPIGRGALAHVMREVVRRNRVGDGTIYLQVSRGAGPRDFYLTDPPLAPTLVVVARAASRSRLEAQAAKGIAVVTMPDLRWKRCDIKTVMLLPAVLAKDAARRHGAREAWLVDEHGFVTEGASSNAWIVGRDGKVVTRPLDERILGGVTRASLLDALRALAIPFEERAFSVVEAHAAQEAFVTAASQTVMPVVKIDGQTIGDGAPGALTRKLREAFHSHARCLPVRQRGLGSHATNF